MSRAQDVATALVNVEKDTLLAIQDRLVNVSKKMIDGEIDIKDWTELGYVMPLFDFYIERMVTNKRNGYNHLSNLPTDRKDAHEALKRRIALLKDHLGPKAIGSVDLCDQQVDPDWHGPFSANTCIVENGHPDNVPHVARNGKMRDNR